MKKLIEEVFSCRSRHDCLRRWVDCRRPEPFIGNLHAKFAIVGANPGSYEGKQRKFNNVTDYVNYYEKEFFESASEKEWAKTWVKGYLEAYRMLINPSAHLADFNENVVLLNVIKCSTEEKLQRIPKWAREGAKNNCVSYLEPDAINKPFARRDLNPR